MRPLTLLLLVSTSLLAQSHREQITVNVVEIPVYVERFGVPRAGLTKDDFELYVNGLRQRIDSVDVIDDQRTVTAAKPELRRRTLVVLLFDIGASAYDSLRGAKRAAGKFVMEAPQGQTFAVATVGRSGINFLVPFTSDRIALRRAIDTLAPSAANDPFRLATIDAERSVFLGPSIGQEAGLGTGADIWGTTQPGGFASSPAASVAGTGAQTADVLEKRELEQSERDIIAALAALADELAPLSGIKHVVLLSERSGLDDPMSTSQAVMRMHRHFRDAGVILDAVDIAPPRAPWPGAKVVSIGIPNLLYTLTLDTGGIAVNSLKTLQEHNRIAYVLAFQPKGPLKNRNTVRVRVKNQPPMTEVRHRAEFTLDDSDADRGIFLADVLMNDIPQNGLSVDVTVKDRTLVASLDGRELLAMAGGKALRLDVFLYVFNDQNLVADWSRSRIEIDAAKGREFLETNRYTIRKELDLPPGHYAAKALIRVVDPRLTGFDRTDFEVADAN